MVWVRSMVRRLLMFLATLTCEGGMRVHAPRGWEEGLQALTPPLLFLYRLVYFRMIKPSAVTSGVIWLWCTFGSLARPTMPVTCSNSLPWLGPGSAAKGGSGRSSRLLTLRDLCASSDPSGLSCRSMGGDMMLAQVQHLFPSVLEEYAGTH